MKRITNIEIENFRAFFGNYVVKLPKGENVLIYGENGSGKSSLFKALKNYFSSSRDNTLVFQKNHHSPTTDDGSIKVSFSDVDPVTHQIIIGSGQTLNFGSASSNNDVQFVKDGDLIKGFLDYRNLLDIYNHKEPIPNLFHLLIEELLFEHFPVGGTEPIGRKYLRLRDALLGVRTRRERKHQNALAELPTLQVEIEDTLRRIFTRVNTLLPSHFHNNLVVDFALVPLTYNYAWNNWHIESDLRLTLRLNGVLITDHQDILNEARLSALATCIYLASVLENPQIGFDLKVLFLDDVFIGLDTGNRLPIIKILNSEFRQHQILIATYDRQWYEVAQRYFNSHAPDMWSSVELYTTKETVGAISFEKPVLLPFEENFDRGVYYLHHKNKPDFPAAANSFRKAAEEILKKGIPPGEIVDENYKLIESYKLSALVNSGLRFLTKIGASTQLLVELKNALPTLLHPLSHYDLTSQVYRSELEDVQRLLQILQRKLLDLKSTYRVFIPEGRKFTLNFTISGTETGHYEILTKETIYLLRDTAGILNVSDGACHSNTGYTILNGNRNGNFNFPRQEYLSVQDSYSKIYSMIHTNPSYAHIPIAANCFTEFNYQNTSGPHSIEHHKGLIIW